MRLIALLLTLLAAPLTANACVELKPCILGERSYHVLPPDGWDGQSPLPVLMHFHGWKRQGTVVVEHPRIAGATRERGVLLVAPNGERRTWDFWRPETPDVAFARAVLEDVAERYPVDRSRIYVSGYSYGSAMAWRFVCQDGADVAALLAVAGTLLQDTHCPEAPGAVRHVHGTSDTVMDFPMGPGGDTSYPVQLWRARMDCAEERSDGDWRVTEHDLFTRTHWSCAGGEVVLDLHPRGHFIPRGWIARQLDELLAEDGAS
ncbi:CE1 family esterase [Halovulum sp. GXIMD14794]